MIRLGDAVGGRPGRVGVSRSEAEHGPPSQLVLWCQPVRSALGPTRSGGAQLTVTRGRSVRPGSVCPCPLPSVLSPFSLPPLSRSPGAAEGPLPLGARPP